MDSGHLPVWAVYSASVEACFGCQRGVEESLMHKWQGSLVCALFYFLQWLTTSQNAKQL